MSNTESFEHLRCRHGHVFSRGYARLERRDDMTIRLACPECGIAEMVPIPGAVVSAIARFAEDHNLEFIHIMGGLKYNSLSGYYYFAYAGMLVGVELDGDIHT